MIELIVIVIIIAYVVNKKNATTRQGRANNNVPPMPNNNMNNFGNNTYQKSNKANNTYDRNVVMPDMNKLSEAQKRYQKANDIVERAKNNTDRLKEDTTLAEIEKMHSHSEKKVQKAVEHSAACQSHLKDNNVTVPEESILGSIEDLMIKGYDGSMSFDRDFVGEALDMISNFTIPDTSVDMADRA